MWVLFGTMELVFLGEGGWMWVGLGLGLGEAASVLC